ncbi:MAG: DUF6463 family protein [Beutenbergiaceae bacterium]
MRRWIGRWIMVVALLHIALGFVMFTEPWIELTQAGFVDAAAASPMRGKAVWYGLFGVLLFVLGASIDALERARQALPATATIGLLVLVLLGIVLMPLSGFWLVVPPAGVALVTRFRKAAKPENVSLRKVEISSEGGE